MRRSVIFRSRLGDLRAWSLYLGLTVPFAILAHLVFDVLDAGFSWTVLSRPAHVVLVGLAAGAALTTAFGLGLGLPSPERRRRLALLRASLQFDRNPLLRIAVGTVAQVMIVLATVSLDEATLHPQRLLPAVFAALLAVVAGGWAIRIAERRVLDLVLHAPRSRRAHRAARAGHVRAGRSTRPYSLFRPNRAPPFPTVSI